MKSLIESKHQKFSFYDCNLTTNWDHFYFERRRMSKCLSQYWKRVKSDGRVKKQRKYSNPILISDNSHSLNLFEWKKGSVRWAAQLESRSEAKTSNVSEWRRANGEQMNRIKFNSSTLFSISFSSHSFILRCCRIALDFDSLPSTLLFILLRHRHRSMFGRIQFTLSSLVL